MALKGNLRDFSITQLLNLINLAQKTGTLVVESPKLAAWVAFRDGKLAYAQMGRDDNSLATILYSTKKLSAAQHRIIIERAPHMSDKELGLLLINASYLTQQDILASLVSHFTGIVQNLFTWGEGFFRFDNDILPPNGKIMVRVNLENIILDGSRKLREYEQLQDEIPSLDIALKFADRPGTNLRSLSLSADEWRVISLINPKNSIRQIAAAVNKNDLEMRRIVYGFLQAGIVELIRPAGAPPIPAMQKQFLQQGSKTEQKSLIQRLISRIRAL